jgi:hypothetical protein
VRRHEDHECVGRDFLDSPQQRESIAVRQAEVEEHEIDLFGHLLERRGRCGRLLYLVAFARQPLPQRPANQILVVNDEHACSRHGAIPAGNIPRQSAENSP